MPADMPTLLDLAKRSGNDLAVGLVDEAARFHPEIAYGLVKTIKGLLYKTLVRVSNGTAGFRHANEGAVVSKSKTINKIVETFFLNPRWECDKAVADTSEDGRDAYIADEADAMFEAAITTLCSQMYYGRGTGGDAKGHPGLIDSVDSSLVLDATGTTASTGSSLWAVRWDTKGVSWVYGGDGKLEVSDLMIARLTDSNGNPFTGYVQELLAHAGIQVLDKFAVGRIKNLTKDVGKTLNDAKVGELISMFPVGKKPTMMFCSRRSLEQLRSSRTATNATGAEAPTPTEVQNIPIYATDAILDTEAIA
jgi:hypothetical protein